MIRFIPSAILFVILSLPDIAQADCVNPPGEAGVQVFNSTYSVMQYCDGDKWIGMGGGADTLTALGCTPGEGVVMGASAWECIAPGAGGSTPDFYVTSGTYNGTAAGTACESGYHICGWTEFYGRAFNKAKSGTSIGGWVVGIYDCAGWTSNSGSAQGVVMSMSDGQIAYNFGGMMAGRCSTANPVMCCQD